MFINRLVPVAVLLPVFLLGSCKTIDNINKTLAAARKTMKNATEKMNKLDEDYESLKGAASQASDGVNVASESGVNVPGNVPGVSSSGEGSGKTGTAKTDIDGDGSEETVEVFAADTGVTYFWWEEDGLCYLAWGDDEVEYIAFGECGSEDGFFICTATNAAPACEACNLQGVCEDCGASYEDCDVPSSGGGGVPDEDSTTTPMEDAFEPEDDTSSMPQDTYSGTDTVSEDTPSQPDTGGFEDSMNWDTGGYWAD